MIYFHVRDYYPILSHFPERSINTSFFNFSQINLTFLPYNPPRLGAEHLTRGKPLLGLPRVRYAISNRGVWAPSFSLAATKEMSFLRTLFYFPPGTEMFYFPGSALYIICTAIAEAIRFPHSEISGSKVARYLPEAYRHQAASFIAFLSQGIHHILLNFPLGNLKTTIRNPFRFHVFWSAFTDHILYPVIWNQSHNKFIFVTCPPPFQDLRKRRGGMNLSM